MRPFEHMKVLNAIPSGVIKDNAAFVSNVIDTGIAGGGATLTFAVNLGTIDADLSTFKVMQSDV